MTFFFFFEKEGRNNLQTNQVKRGAHVFEIRLDKVVHIYYINGEVDVQLTVENCW